MMFKRFSWRQKRHLKINTKERFKEKKIIWYHILLTSFLVEHHLDDVVEFLLVVGVEFFLTKLVDEYWIQKEDSLKELWWNKWRNYLTFQPFEKKAIEVWATKNFMKDKITERVDIYNGAFLRKLQKFKIEVTGPEKAQHFVFYEILCSSNFLWLNFT